MTARTDWYAEAANELDAEIYHPDAEMVYAARAQARATLALVDAVRELTERLAPRPEGGAHIESVEASLDGIGAHEVEEVES